MNYIQLQYADIYYNITSKDDILRLSKNDRFQGIMKFFNLQNLSNKAIIKIWDNYEEFSDFWKEKYHQETSPNTLTGFCYEHNHIEIVDLANYIEIKKIKNQDVNFDDWYNLMIHEFTHYCTKEYTNYTLGSKWIQEGLAINLSHQRFYNFIITSSLEEIQNNKCTYDDAYTLINYLLKNYSHEFVLDFLLDKNLQNEILIEIYNILKK